MQEMPAQRQNPLSLRQQEPWGKCTRQTALYHTVVSSVSRSVCMPPVEAEILILAEQSLCVVLLCLYQPSQALHNRCACYR
jgi:hypothetical protein